MVLHVDGQRHQVVNVIEDGRIGVSHVVFPQLPENYELSFTFDPGNSGNIDAIFDAVAKAQKLAARRRDTRKANAKLTAAIPVLQANHDQRVGAKNTAAAHANRQSAHKIRMAA